MPHSAASPSTAAVAPPTDFYRALFEDAYDAQLLYNEQGLLVDCNKAILNLLGVSRPDLQTNGLMALTIPTAANGEWDNEPTLREAVRYTARTGTDASQPWLARRPNQRNLTAQIILRRLTFPNGLVRVQLILRESAPAMQTQALEVQQLVLDRTQEQVRDLLSRTTLSYVLIDRLGNVVDVNDFFLEFTGYNREEIIGRPYHATFSPPAERDVRLQSYLTCIQEERLQEFYERSLLTKNGQARMVYWHAEFARDAAGTVTGMFVVGRDFTERHVAARALTDNRNRLQDFLDNAHDLIQNLSIDNRLLFVNKAWKEKLGYEDEDLPNLTLSDVVHPYYKAKLLYQLRNLYKGEKVNKLETVFLTKTGKPVHLIGSISCSWQDNEPVSTRAILHDITDRIKAERLQKVYYSIANLAISSKDLHSLYGAIHRELSKIIETNNFYIALCDEARTQLQFAYYVDQNTPGEVAAASRPFSSGMSEYIIRTGRPQYLLRHELEELITSGTITAYGLMPEVMLCSPLSIGERIIGVIAVQDYHKADAYAPTDLEILHFISNQVALAIERKRNEVQIQKQNARLNAIFESGSHLMWSVDTHSRLTSFNRNYAAYFLRRNGVYPAPNVNLFQGDLAMMEEDARELFVENYRLAFQGQAQRFEVRLRDVRSADSWREIFLNPIYLDDGSFEEISGIAHDITDKKRSQLELAAQEEKFRAIFESFQDVYYRTDDQGILTLVSPSVLDMLGYEPDQVIGTPISRYYVHADERDNLLRVIQTEGDARNFPIEMRHKKGYIVSMLVNARLVTGGVTGTEGIARDITSLNQMQIDLRRAKDEAETALEAKTLFLANMSHELRTPMNGIIGMIDLLHQTVNSEEQEEYVDTLRKSSDALLAILNDILDLSKIQAGKLQLNEEGMDLHYTLEKIHSLFANRAQQKRLTFTYHIAPNTPRFIVTDETRLLQILSNLTSNAIKFTSQGTVSIIVSTDRREGDEYRLRIAVQDSGIGISMENAKLLFTNFTQLDTTPTKAFGGTGLGLAISKQLAELLGGEIGVLSNEGDGSTFWFTIRCTTAHNETEIVQERLASRERAPDIARFDTSPRVLLVDDNPINLKVAIRLLDKLGCEVAVADNGFEAISKATAPGAEFDLIFMDIQMPEMDGVAAMQEIRRRMSTACPPVVAMTAYSMKEDAERFVREGMDDYVSKPVKSQDLHSVLRRWVTAGPAVNRSTYTTEVVEATPTATPEVPFIDPEVIEQLRQLGGAEFAAQLYEDFEVEAGQLFVDAQTLVDSGQYEQILPHLHQLKGTGFTLGLTLLAECAKELEHDLKKGDTSNAVQDFQKLTDYFTQFKAVYPGLTSAK